MKKQLLDLDNARENEQTQIMKKIIDDGICPFCVENYSKYNSQDFLKEGKYWYIVKNRWPYKSTKVHLLLIYKEHVVDLAGLDSASGKELLDFVKWIEREYKVPGGGWSMRFGDTDYSAGTVNHIHVQFIQPDINSSSYEPVKIKIGKRFNK